MTLKKAAECCGGKLFGCKDDALGICRAVIDSRAVEPGDLFVAYRGEKTDGHRFIQSALDKGAVCALAEYIPEDVAGPVLIVEDVQTALEKICTVYRETLNIPVIGITGSVGKTTAKEMIASVLSQHYNTLKTEGNHNNQIGVPMTVSRIESEHEAAVVEMGISGFGEMTELASVAKPTVAVFTVIGRAHLEFLHDLEGVFRAKTEMLTFLPENGTVIANGDDALLKNISCPQRVLLYGTGETCDVRADQIELLPEGRTRCRIRYQDRVIRADVPAFGRQLVYAALEGAAVGIVLGLTDAEIEAGIASYATVGRRNAQQGGLARDLLDGHPFVQKSLSVGCEIGFQALCLAAADHDGLVFCPLACQRNGKLTQEVLAVRQVSHSLLHNSVRQHIGNLALQGAHRLTCIQLQFTLCVGVQFCSLLLSLSLDALSLLPGLSQYLGSLLLSLLDDAAGLSLTFLHALSIELFGEFLNFFHAVFSM